MGLRSLNPHFLLSQLSSIICLLQWIVMKVKWNHRCLSTLETVTTSTLVIIRAHGEGTCWRDCMVPLVHLLGSSPTQRYLGKETQPLSLILASQLGEGRLYVAETHTCGLCEQQWFNSRQLSKRTPFANCKHNSTRPQVGLLGPCGVTEDCHLQAHPPPGRARMWPSVLFPSFGRTVAAY